MISRWQSAYRRYFLRCPTLTVWPEEGGLRQRFFAALLVLRWGHRCAVSVSSDRGNRSQSRMYLHPTIAEVMANQEQYNRSTQSHALVLAAVLGPSNVAHATQVTAFMTFQQKIEMSRHMEDKGVWTRNLQTLLDAI